MTTTTTGAATGLPEILPTHTCFDDALDFFDLFTEEHVLRTHEQMRVVHAVCRGRALGTLYAHAWAEDGDLVWQRGIVRAAPDVEVYFALPRDAFYELYQVQQDRLTRYTVWEACELMLHHGHYGPWLDEYRALCNDTPGGRVLGSMSGLQPVKVLRVIGGSR